MTDKTEHPPLSPRPVVATLDRLVRELTAFEPKVEELGIEAEWTVGPFRFVYTRPEPDVRWSILLTHPDGDELQILQQPHSLSVRPHWAFTINGLWDDALQLALDGINDASQDDQPQFADRGRNPEANRISATARDTAKFETMFQGEAISAEGPDG